MAALDGSGPLLSCVPPSVLDLDEVGTGCDLAVDMRRDLGLKAFSVQALVGNHVGKKGGVVSAAAGAGGASSGCGVEGLLFAVERRIGQGERKVALYPRGEELGG
jgi:hypothetical protein